MAWYNPKTWFKKKETTTVTTTTPPKTSGVLVTDLTTGENVVTKTENGNVTSQQYTPAPTKTTTSRRSGGSTNIGEERALALANREGGIVSTSTTKKSTGNPLTPAASENVLTQNTIKKEGGFSSAEKQIKEDQTRQEINARAERYRSFNFQKEDFTGGGNFNLWNTAGQMFVFSGDFLSAQLRLDKIFPNDKIINSSPFKQGAAEFAAFSFFSPAMATTAQIYKEVNTVREVTFSGASQRQENGKIVTDIYYESSTGNRGVVKGITEQEGNKFFTQSVGGSGRNVYNLPSTKPIFNLEKNFYGSEYGVISGNKNTFVSVSKGVISSDGKNWAKYAASNVGLNFEKVAVSGGGVATESGNAIVKGAVVKVGGETTNIISGVKYGGNFLDMFSENTLAQITKQVSVIQTQNTAAAFISTQGTKAATNFIPGIASVSEKIITKTETQTSFISAPQTFGVKVTDYEGGGTLITKTEGGQITKMFSPFTPTGEVQRTDTGTRGITKTIIRTSPGTDQTETPKIIETPTQTNTPRMYTPTTPKISGLLITKNPVPASPIIPIDFGGDYFPPFYFKGGISTGVQSNALKGGFRQVAYQPSFRALVFGETGIYKKGKLSLSGLDYRPITSSFRINIGRLRL